MIKVLRSIKYRLFSAYAEFYAFLHPKKGKYTADTNRVLIAACGGMGDGLMAAQMLRELIDLYQKQGKKVTLVCSKDEYTAYVLTLDTNSIEFEACDWNKLEEPYAVAKKVSQRNYDEMVSIVRWNSYGMLYLLAKIRANQKLATFQDTGDSFTRTHRRMTLARRLVDRAFLFSDDTSEKTELRKLAETAGASHYQIATSFIPKQCSYTPPSDNYVTIAIDSNDIRRRWDIQKFIALARKLLEKYPYDIIFTGSKVAPDTLRSVEEAFKNNDRIKIAVGTTTLSQFVELLRGSNFHVGVDSGSIHIAASVGTLAFCLTGVWEGQTYFPYIVEEPDRRTAVPIPVYRKDIEAKELPCFACKRHGGYGHNNRTCAVRCKKGQACLCLDNISVEDVLSVICKSFEEGNAIICKEP